MSAQETFGATLRSEREKKNLTQEQLAEKCGLSRLQIIRLEKDQQGPSWDTVKAICRALGLDCKAFEGPPGPPAAAKVAKPGAKPKRKKPQKGE